jgi:rRNA maturation protein Nop10
MKLKKCKVCNKYTLKNKCLKCNKKISEAHYKYVRTKDHS